MISGVISICSLMVDDCRRNRTFFLFSCSFFVPTMAFSAVFPRKLDDVLNGFTGDRHVIGHQGCVFRYRRHFDEFRHACGAAIHHRRIACVAEKRREGVHLFGARTLLYGCGA